MRYSAYKLNKQGDNILPCHTPFQVLNESVVPCKVLTCFLTHIQVSHETGNVVWSFHLFKDFPQFVVIYLVKSFSIVNEAEVNVFQELPYFFHDPSNVGSLISGSFIFSKPSLYIWKFSVYVLLKPCLKDFEHNLIGM